MATRYAPFGGRQTYLSDIERANQVAALQNVANEMRAQQGMQEALSGDIWRQHQGSMAEEAGARRSAESALDREFRERMTGRGEDFSRQMMERKAELGQEAQERAQLFNALEMAAREQAGERAGQKAFERKLGAMTYGAELGERAAESAAGRRMQELGIRGQQDLMMQMLKDEAKKTGGDSKQAKEFTKFIEDKDAKGLSITPEEQELYRMAKAQVTGASPEMIIPEAEIQGQKVERDRQAVEGAIMSIPSINNDVAIAKEMMEEATWNVGALSAAMKTVTGEEPMISRAELDDPKKSLKRVSEAIDRAVMNAVGGGYVPKEMKKTLRDVIATNVVKAHESGSAGSIKRGIRGLDKEFDDLPGETVGEKLASSIGLNVSQAELDAHPMIEGF